MHTKNENIIAIAVAAISLLTTNLLIEQASLAGKIAPVSNYPLWYGFVAFNIISIVWVTALLGISPLTVSISYVSGGLLVGWGIAMADSISVGTSCAALGAILAGSVATRQRTTFYVKRQQPFLMIALLLLIINTTLYGRLWTLELNVLLFSVVWPLLLTGVAVGLLCALLHFFWLTYKERSSDRISPSMPIPPSAPPPEKISVPEPQKMNAPETEPMDDDLDDDLEADRNHSVPLLKLSDLQNISNANTAEELEDEDEDEEELGTFFPLEIDLDDDGKLEDDGEGIGSIMAKMCRDNAQNSQPTVPERPPERKPKPTFDSPKSAQKITPKPAAQFPPPKEDPPPSANPWA